MSFQGFLKQSTAVDILLGPFLDETDGKTAETGLTLSQADIKLSKNGQALAQKTDVTAAAADANGYYNCELDATDTNTAGQLTIICHESGALPVRLDYHVVEEAVYDAMYGASATGPLQSTTGGRTLTVSANGEANADLTFIHGTALTETATQLAGAFVKFFDVASPTGTVNSLPDAIPDAAGGLPISDAGGLDMDNMILDAILAARLWSDGREDTWFVDGTNGAGGNSGTLPEDALDTVAAAVAVAGAGDTIVIAPGSYAAFDASGVDGLHFIGAGKALSLIDSGVDVECANGQTFDHIGFDLTGHGIDCTGNSDIVIRDCNVAGDVDGLMAQGAIRIVVERCYISGTYDAANLSLTSSFNVIDSTFVTDASNATANRAVLLTQASGTFTRCRLEAIQTAQSTYAVSAIQADSLTKPINCIDCLFVAKVTHASSTGNVIGVDFSANADTMGGVHLTGCTIRTQNLGSGTVHDLVQATAGELRVSGTSYDTAKTNGTITDTDSAYTGTPPTAADIVNEWETQSQADPTGFRVNVMEDHGVDSRDQISQIVYPDTYFVSKSGNDSNSGLSPLTADLTIGAAVTAASAGDAIHIGPGTFAEAVDTSAMDGFRLTGSGKGTTYLTTGTIGVTTGNDTRVEHMSIIGSLVGLQCNGKDGCVLADCEIYGATDAIQALSTPNLHVERCYLQSTWDGVAFTTATGLHVSETWFETDVSGATGEGRAVTMNGADGVFNNCTFRAVQTSEETTDVVALNATSVTKPILCNNCSFIAIIDHASSSGNVIGVDFGGDATENGLLTLSGCNVYVRNDGSGTDTDIKQATGGKFEVSGTTYDSTNTSGTITDVDAAIKTKTDYLPSATAGAAGGVFIAGTNAATVVTTSFTTTFAGNLSGSVASVVGSVTTDAASRTASKADVSGLATATALTTVDTVVDAIKVVTDALTAAGAAKLATTTALMATGTATSTTLSTTQMSTGLTEATDDHYNGRVILWTSGVLENQATDITDYDGTTKTLTFTAVTEAPSDGDGFVIV